MSEDNIKESNNLGAELIQDQPQLASTPKNDPMSKFNVMFDETFDVRTDYQTTL